MHLQKLENIEAIWLFRIFSEVQNLKIFLNALLKKLFEAYLVVSNIFWGVDSEKNHEYTLEKKKSPKQFGCFERFLGCIF